MAQPLVITLNGAERSFDELGDDSAIDQLVATLGFRADRVALERNGEIVSRKDWASTLLNNGDRIELVHFVGGGVC